MDARRRGTKAATMFFLACMLASGSGCNPFGWGVSQVKSLIHHHAHKPIIRDFDEPADASAPAARSSSPAIDRKRTA